MCRIERGQDCEVGDEWVMFGNMVPVNNESEKFNMSCLCGLYWLYYKQVFYICVDDILRELVNYLEENYHWNIFIWIWHFTVFMNIQELGYDNLKIKLYLTATLYMHIYIQNDIDSTEVKNDDVYLMTVLSDLQVW